jgi:hypothetical protein
MGKSQISGTLFCNKGTRSTKRKKKNEHGTGLKSAFLRSTDCLVFADDDTKKTPNNLKRCRHSLFLGHHQRALSVMLLLVWFSRILIVKVGVGIHGRIGESVGKGIEQWNSDK